MLETKAIYPQPVLERAEEIFNGLKDAGYTTDVDTQLLFENLCKFFLEKFLIGDETMAITEDECDELYVCTGIDGGIQDLINNGLMDSIEDENGVEILFTTEKGRNEGL
jgi:hypothetical protein